MTAGGAALELAALTGPAVVNLWATWCGPCRRELPAFQEVSEARPDVRFIGIDIGEDAATPGTTSTSSASRSSSSSTRTAASPTRSAPASLPVTLVVGADGTLPRRTLGPMSVDGARGGAGRALS